MKKIFLLLILSVMTMRIYPDGFDCIQGNWVQLSFDESETIYSIIDGYNKLDLYRSDELQSASEEHIVLVKSHLLESEYDSRPLNQDSKIEEIEDRNSKVGVFVTDRPDGWDAFGTNGRLGSGSHTAWPVSCDEESMYIYNHEYIRMTNFSFHFLSLLRDVSIKNLKNYVLKYLKFELALPVKESINGEKDGENIQIGKKDILRVLKTDGATCQVEVWTKNKGTIQCNVKKEDITFLGDYIDENR